MTTVSRFSLASELLCFSRFDEGEYMLLKPDSHGTARADRRASDRSRRIARRSIGAAAIFPPRGPPRLRSESLKIHRSRRTRPLRDRSASRVPL